MGCLWCTGVVGMDSDPLQLQQLAVAYDYLMYKIGDHVLLLCDRTCRSVATKLALVRRDYFGQLRLEDTLNEVDGLLARCTEVENDYAKLEQLYLFVESFKERLRVLEEGLAAHQA